MKLDLCVWFMRDPRTRVHTEAAVRHDNVHVTAALLATLLAPVLDADRLIGFHHVGDLQIRVDLREQ